MKTELSTSILLSGLIIGAFLLGRSTSPQTLLDAPLLEAQDRGPGGQGPGRGPELPPIPLSGPVTAPPKPAAPLVYGGDAANTGSANGFIAVTGSYGVGTSVLYILDTHTKQLAVYEARGGSRGSRSMFLVGARKIDLDLQLLQYNDDSEFPYEALRRRFEDSHKSSSDGKAAPAAGATKTPGSGSEK
jgi:hypothetical protein